MKYPPLLIKNLAKLIVGDNTPNRLTGKDLVDFFNEFGFGDDYEYPSVGITTGDIGTGLSRTDYARKRLAILNEKQKIDVVISLYLDNCEDKSYADDAIKQLICRAPELAAHPAPAATLMFTPASQFDNIPENVPIVFISYSWDNDEVHMAWVKKLADDLRSKYAVYTLLDQYNSGGASLVEFMDRGLRISHRVLMVGTPGYKHRAEDGFGTGSKYEGSIINADIYYNTNTNKFIPILRKGESFKESFINIISVRNGYDFRNDSLYETNLKKLADDLYGRGEKAPALGNAAVQSKQNPDEAVPAEYKGERWLYELMKFFSFFLMDDYFVRMPCRFDQRVLIMFDTWNGIINSSVYHINNEELKENINRFFQSWKEICEYGWKYYSCSSNGIDYVFYGVEFDMFTDLEHEDAFNRIKEMIVELYPKYKAFVHFLDVYFPHIDREKVSVDFTRMVDKQT